MADYVKIELQDELSMASMTNKGAAVDDADFASTGLGLAVAGEVELKNYWQMAHVQ